ncbi:aminopeptidase P family protein [Clostridium sp. 'deep sea']|uniref:M24 family metallopeptidase n=1 Tax=Clostridium sp. 'deep sea' TaxID=2779445 RepID=UPI00189660F4|nr:Xaa-Pro peptidase family protein [Clostridium sp. 'deep sea']QOR36926.1 aminopeptidase P family protein [Clostridium sp. 'deep sea']
MGNRINKLRDLMKTQNLQSVLVVKPENRYYMSGFTGSNGFLVITQKSAKLITDFRYTEQATAQCPNYEVVLYKRTDLHEIINQALADESLTQLGFDKTFTTYASYLAYKEKIEAEIVPYEKIIENIRLIKDETEIRNMQQAQTIAEDAFSKVLKMIKSGITELDVAVELEYNMKKLGAEKISFATIAASGKRSSLPHGRASQKVIEHGDFITFDFGAYYNGYCSDMTRTIVVGEASDKQREIYGIVLKAQLAALKMCKPGVNGKDVDKVARDIITQAGYGENFGHGLGHGVGKMVHEGPSLSPLSQDILQPGHVVTVEPGIYIPGWGGVRIEDMVIITEDGHFNFNKLSKELIII